MPEHAIDQQGLVPAAFAAPTDVRRDDLAERLVVLGVSRDTDGLGRSRHVASSRYPRVRAKPFRSQPYPYSAWPSCCIIVAESL